MNRAQLPLARFLLVAVLLAGTTILLRARGEREQLPSRQPLSSFPLSIAGWQGRDLGIDPSVREILGPGELLSRGYTQAGQSYIDFFVGYFPSQRMGNSIHSPRNCLPGSGWSPVEAGRLELSWPGHAPAVVNSYVISKGMDRQVVLYWYQAHDRIIASEYKAKYYLVADAIRMNRSDGALVRIVTPLSRHESVSDGQRRAAAFAKGILPLLVDYIPR